MSYSRYNIEQQYASYDRGVTWEIVQGSTRYGKLVATTMTLAECEDTACDLDEYRYELEDSTELPTEFCNTAWALPFGIAKTISWTRGAVCCDVWRWANGWSVTPYGAKNMNMPLGKVVSGGGYGTSFRYNTNVGVNGSEVHNGYTEACGGNIGTCFQIAELMPWVREKSSFKLVVKKHYVREHCSEEWVHVGNDEYIGVGERWYPTVHGQYISWQHQEVESVDSETETPISWVDLDEAPIVELIGRDIPEGYTWDDSLSFDYGDFTEITVSRFNVGTYSNILFSLRLKGCFVRQGTEVSSKLVSLNSDNQYVKAQNEVLVYATGCSQTACGKIQANTTVSGYGYICLSPDEYQWFDQKYVYTAGTASASYWVDATVNALDSISIKEINVIFADSGRIRKRLIPVERDGVKYVFDVMSGNVWALT